MSTKRRQAREFALQILYQSETLSKPPWEVVPQFFQNNPGPAEIAEYAKALACGVGENKSALDQAIAKASEHWKVSRMSEVDRNILRIAAYEMLYRDDIPREVCMDEAIEIAKKYGTEDSPAFVNGVLDHIIK